jgi:hypothetical protein
MLIQHYAPLVVQRYPSYLRLPVASQSDQSCVFIHFLLVCRHLKLFLCSAFVFFPHRPPCRRAPLALHHHQSVHCVILSATTTNDIL